MRLFPSPLTCSTESYERWDEATNADLVSERVNEGAMGTTISPLLTFTWTLTSILAFMLHISGHLSLTKYALEKSGTLHGMPFHALPREEVPS